MVQNTQAPNIRPFSGVLAQLWPFPAEKIENFCSRPIFGQHRIFNVNLPKTLWYDTGMVKNGMVGGWEANHTIWNRFDGISHQF